MERHRVIIAHPGRQHAHQTAYAFQEGGIPFRLITSIWHTPSHFPYTIIPHLPRGIQKQIGYELRKKSFPLLQEENISTYPLRKTFSYATQRLLRTRLQERELFEFREGKRFDNWTARIVKDLRPQMYIGYELSCLETFRACKETGTVCVLDHAATHYKFQQSTREKFCIKDNVSQYTRHMINSKKYEELTLADYILTPSSYTKQIFIGYGISEKKLLTIPYGTDISLLSSRKIKKHTKKLRVLFTGTPSYEKGIAVIEKAIQKLDNCMFIFAGSMTPELNKLLELYKGKVKYVGYLHREKLVNTYQQSDIFILPSFSDSFGLSVLEAMACGVPVIITKYTGAKDVVRNGIDGWIIPPGNPKILISRISWADSHRNSIAAMRENAHAQARKYTWKRYRSSIRTMYNTITNDAN